jgi:hypothetical protein
MNCGEPNAYFISFFRVFYLRVIDTYKLNYVWLIIGLELYMIDLLIIYATSFASCIKLYELKLKGRDHPQDLDIDSMVTLEDVRSVQAANVRVQWCAYANTVMNLWDP